MTCPPWLITQTHRAPAKRVHVRKMCPMHYSFVSGGVRMCYLCKGCDVHYEIAQTLAKPAPKLIYVYINAYLHISTGGTVVITPQ